MRDKYCPKCGGMMERDVTEEQGRPIWKCSTCGIAMKRREEE